MTGEQLLNALREVKEAAEKELGSKCDVSLYVDREHHNDGLILEIKHKLGRFEGDGLCYHVRLDTGDNFVDGLRIQTLVAWIREQRAIYASRLLRP